MVLQWENIIHGTGCTVVFIIQVTSQSRRALSYQQWQGTTLQDLQTWHYHTTSAPHPLTNTNMPALSERVSLIYCIYTFFFLFLFLACIFLPCSVFLSEETSYVYPTLPWQRHRIIVDVISALKGKSKDVLCYVVRMFNVSIPFF